MMIAKKMLKIIIIKLKQNKRRRRKACKKEVYSIDKIRKKRLMSNKRNK